MIGKFIIKDMSIMTIITTTSRMLKRKATRTITLIVVQFTSLLLRSTLLQSSEAEARAETSTFAICFFNSVRVDPPEPVVFIAAAQGFGC